MDYLTNRLVRAIKKGGMIIAPRRAGKTQAILEVLKQSDEYILICFSCSFARHLQDQFSMMTTRSNTDIRQAIIGPRSIKRSNKKIIIDEFFWNPAFVGGTEYHCAISSNPRDLILYNKTGRRMKIAYNEVWKG